MEELFIIAMNMQIELQLTRINMKKLSALLMLIATAILSGALLSRFLNWAGSEEIFDFDLNEDIDNEQF